MTTGSEPLPFMRWYAPRPPAGDLTDQVDCVWTARPEAEHRLVPDGCVDIVWLDDGRAWVCGTETEAWTFRLPAGVEAAGIRFRPGVAGAVLGFQGLDVANRRVPVDAVLSGAAARRLHERLAAAAPDGRGAVFEAEARGWVARSARPVDPVGRAAAASVGRPRPAPVDGLARELGVSSRQLHRRCLRTFGYGPVTLTRILRLQRFLGLATGGSSLATLAVRSGYSDQAHLTRECRAIAGVTPGALLGRSDPFKTPAPQGATMGP